MTSMRPRETNVKFHEKLYYNVYEGDEVVASDVIQGHSFMQLGKYRMAQMVAGAIDPGNAKLDRYRVMRSGPTYTLSTATVVSWNDDGSEGRITAQTEEFNTEGIYLRVEGSHSNDSVTSYYHYITTNITIGSGQTVRFFVEYTFTNLGDEAGGLNSSAVQGNSIAAAILFQQAAGEWLVPIGRLGMVDSQPGPTYQSSWNNDIGISVSNDTSNNRGYLLISGENWSIGWSSMVRALRVVTSAADPTPGVRVFHAWTDDGTGDSTGPFSIINGLGSGIWLPFQTDVVFTFG